MPQVAREFVHEYQEELTSFFRRRLIWYLLTMLGYMIFVSGLMVAIDLLSNKSTMSTAIALAIGAGPSLVIYVGAIIATRYGGHDHDDLVVLAWFTIQLQSLTATTASVIALKFGITGVSSPSLFSVFFTLTAASLFLPWTNLQCLAAFAPQLWIWAIGKAIVAGGIGAIIPDLFFAPLVALPSLLICSWRMNSFERSFDHRMVRQAFTTIKRELVDARRVHESLFPKPVHDGSIRLWYSYQPMRQIGGDFLHVHTDEHGRMHFVVLDVTGHGIAAALTVNRLAGEIERLQAEDMAYADLNKDGELDPGELLAALNRYIWLTLARHSVFATAFCARIDPGKEGKPGRIAWASGGHPPAMLRRVDGGIDELASTTYMLGAVPPDVFDASIMKTDFHSGDCLLAYTDGAFEAMNRNGESFGLARLRRTVATSPRTAAECVSYVRQAVDSFRYGPNDDDILIVAANLRPETEILPKAPRLETKEVMAAVIRS